MSNFVDNIPLDLRNSSGIYCIRNLINGKRYIGSTKNFRKRLNMYKHKFKTNGLHNDYLHKSFEKYGLNNFSFELVKTCNENQLLELENYYQEKFNTRNKSIGYNIAIPDRPSEVSQETRDKISKAKKGCSYSEEIKNTMKLASLRYWKTKQGKETRRKIVESRNEFNRNHPNRKNKMPENFRKMMAEKNLIKNKSVLQLDKDTEEIINEYPSLRIAEESLGKKQCHISCVCNNKYGFKTAYGFKWRFKNE